MSEDSKKKEGLFAHLKNDLPASIIVFFVAVPLCLGIALASGAPLFSGLIAGMVGGVIVGGISNSALGVSGPAAGLALTVAAAIVSLGSFEIFLVSVVIAGVLQILLGVLKGGVIGYYFPSSVIKGMLTGIGLSIILKNIPHAFGYDADYQGDLTFIQADGENSFSELINMLNYISPGAIVVSIISLSILLVWDNVLAKKANFFKLVQGPLVAVFVGVGYQLLANKYFPFFGIGENHLVKVPVAESFDSFIDQFSFPTFSALGNFEVWLTGGVIAFVASIETLLSVEATDKLDPKKRVTNTNRELIAQGTGNIVSGLIGGIPVTQVIVRSSVNVQSGGQTKLSGIIHGFLILLCIAFIPFVLNMIPYAVLASILLVVGFKLAKPALFKQMLKLGWSQFIPFVVTIFGLVFIGLLEGVGFGLGVGIIVILLNSFKNSHFLHKEVEDESPRVVRMTLAEEVTFINKGAILNSLKDVKKGSHLIIDMSKSKSIDYDVLEIIDNYKDSSESKGVTVELINREFTETADY